MTSRPTVAAFVRMDPKLKDWIVAEARRARTSLSRYIEDVLVQKMTAKRRKAVK